ncbi:MAG: FtsX-like permease family protein [Bacteroidales bacterium]
MCCLGSDDQVRKYPVLKQALKENPEIKSVTSTDTPLGEGSGKLLFSVETDQGMSPRGINFAIVDHDFVKTLGISISKGRNFQEDMPSDTLKAVLVNETFVKRMGWNEPIGKKIEAGNGNFITALVVGVFKDYHQTGMYNQIESLLLAYRTRNNVVYIKLGNNNIKETIAFIENKWKTVFPDQPFTYTFLSERFNRQFEADEKRGLIFTIFTILAIVIACLGLFGLASYMVEQRTKEVGVRKVFGANEMVIIKLISREFIILISVSVLIAFPTAYYFMSNWLQNYVYRSRLNALIFLTAAVLTLIITFLTISYKAWKASVLNPAESIRTE